MQDTFQERSICADLLLKVRAFSLTLGTRAFAAVAWTVAAILIGHNLWKLNGGIS